MGKKKKEHRKKVQNWKKKIDDTFNQYRNESRKKMIPSKGDFLPLTGSGHSKDIDILV
jgi:transcription elongation factor Elf1